jgi:hypothetical protein
VRDATDIAAAYAAKAALEVEKRCEGLRRQ